MKTETIPRNKHVLVCGMTGTGKSYLCEQYLKNYNYVVKLDTKNEVDERKMEGKSAWDGLVEGRDFSIVRHFDELDDIETSHIIYAPVFEEQTQDNFELFFNWIFMRGNTILWIDELMSIGTSSTYPLGLKRLMTMGRSKNIGVWSCTQRPTGIPNCVPSNCSYFFVFDLTLSADRKKMIETTGMEEMRVRPTGYKFWYYKLGDRTCNKCQLR